MSGKTSSKHLNAARKSIRSPARHEQRRVRCLVMGSQGAGKSSLLNLFFYAMQSSADARIPVAAAAPSVEPKKPTGLKALFKNKETSGGASVERCTLDYRQIPVAGVPDIIFYDIAGFDTIFTGPSKSPEPVAPHSDSGELEPPPPPPKIKAEESAEATLAAVLQGVRPGFTLDLGTDTTGVTIPKKLLEYTDEHMIDVLLYVVKWRSFVTPNRDRKLEWASNVKHLEAFVKRQRASSYASLLSIIVVFTHAPEKSCSTKMQHELFVLCPSFQEGNTFFIDNYNFGAVGHKKLNSNLDMQALRILEVIRHQPRRERLHEATGVASEAAWPTSAAAAAAPPEPTYASAASPAPSSSSRKL